MTNWIVVTAGGFGSVFSFADEDDAHDHPVTQYGDSVMSQPTDIISQYNWLQFPRLLTLIGDETDLPQIDVPSQQRAHIESECKRVWEMLIGMAVPPPSDMMSITEQVKNDRKKLLKEKTMTDTKEKKEPTKRAPAFAEDAKIVMQNDKEGNAYGGKNNPKRKGSKSAERFAQIKNGMTVKKALETDYTTADMANDVSKGYIKVEAA